MNWYTNLIFYGGIINAFAVIILGLVSAAIYLLGTEAEIFWRRILPACSVAHLQQFRGRAHPHRRTVGYRHPMNTIASR